MERKNVLTFSIIHIIVFFLVAGIFIYAQRPALFHQTTPWMLLAIALSATYYAPRKAYLWIAIATFLVEALGVWTGFPFGNYYYTERLGLSLLSVPLIIGINWVVVIIGAKQLLFLLARKVSWLRKRWHFAVGTGLLAVLFDIFLEPIAIALEWWVWPQGVGLPNYLSWFAIGAIASLWIRQENKFLFPALYIAQLLFFIGMLAVI